ncbi:DUF4870 domain-containing protein [Vampirovibrio sp.]|uniref:DUF4870 domain-containing protein n=1 Tax=Vampirovibrio sp. TaxID=2717857 RepID=UPI003593FE58
MVNTLSNEPNSDDKLWAGLSYAGLICCMIPTIVIFLLKKGESDYIKFNGLQAMGFWLALVIVQVGLGVTTSIPGIGIITGLIWVLLGIASFGVWVYLIIMAFTGKTFKIPVLAEFIESNLMR